MDPLSVGHYTLAVERANKLANEYWEVMAEVAVLIEQARIRRAYVDFNPNRTKGLLDRASGLSDQIVAAVAEANQYAAAAGRPRLATNRCGD